MGATETVLLSAVLAEGRTVIHNAATEPEVVELALFLQRMGAHIALRPDRRFVIEGVESLTGATAHLQGDRLEAFSYLVAGLMTGGEVRVGGCDQDRMVTAINTLQRMGADFEINDEWISASAAQLRPSAVQTDTHPGFMTDWQPPLIVLMTQADGMSVLHETVYEDRLGYVDALKAMGGEIELFDTCLGGPACRFHDSSAVHSAVVRGVSKLQGADVTIPDVRAGFSSVIAAAAAEGPSTLHGIHHLERGYNAPARDAGVARPPAAPHLSGSAGEERAERPEGRHQADGGEHDAADERGLLEITLPAGLRRAHDGQDAAHRHGGAEGEHEVGEDVRAAEHGPEATRPLPTPPISRSVRARAAEKGGVTGGKPLKVVAGWVDWPRRPAVIAPAGHHGNGTGVATPSNCIEPGPRGPGTLP